MVCLGLEPRAAEWQAQMNPLSYGGTPKTHKLIILYHYPITNLHSGSSGVVSAHRPSLQPTGGPSNL